MKNTEKSENNFTFTKFQNDLVSHLPDSCQNQGSETGQVTNWQGLHYLIHGHKLVFSAIFGW